MDHWITDRLQGKSSFSLAQPTLLRLPDLAGLGRPDPENSGENVPKLRPVHWAKSDVTEANIQKVGWRNNCAKALLFAFKTHKTNYLEFPVF